MSIRIALRAMVLVLLSVAVATAARAADTVKVAIGQIDAWANQAPTLGMKAGIFQKHGIVLETFGTQGAGETLQAVISGSADIGIGIGTAGAMRAFARGAPVRAIAAAYVGVGDQYWYVPANSPLKSLADATEKHTLSYSTNGSTSHVIALGFVKQLGVKAKPTATGGPPATYTMTMTGQIDIGWAVVPFGLLELQDGKIRVIARGPDVPTLRNQTIRVQIVNANALKDRKDVMVRFMRGYREFDRLDVFQSARGQILRRDDQAAGKPGCDAARSIQPEGGIVAGPALRHRSGHGRRGGDEVPRRAVEQGSARGFLPDPGARIVTPSVRTAACGGQCRGLRVQLTMNPSVTA